MGSSLSGCGMKGAGMNSTAYPPASPCANVRRNADGSWTTIAEVLLTDAAGNRVPLPAGITFGRGSTVNGIDIAAWLDANCR